MVKHNEYAGIKSLQCSEYCNILFSITVLELEKSPTELPNGLCAIFAVFKSAKTEALVSLLVTLYKISNHAKISFQQSSSIVMLEHCWRLNLSIELVLVTSAYVCADCILLHLNPSGLPP